MYMLHRLPPRGETTGGAITCEVAAVFAQAADVQWSHPGLGGPCSPYMPPHPYVALGLRV